MGQSVVPPAVQQSHLEHHHGDRIGWLRASAPGANDGIVSTASLVLGLAAAGAGHGTILRTAVSGLIAGAMSMAAGEFVSVHSRQEPENADLNQERGERQRDPAGERRELAAVCVGRGPDPWVSLSSLAFLASLGEVSAYGLFTLSEGSCRVANPRHRRHDGCGLRLAGARLSSHASPLGV